MLNLAFSMVLGMLWLKTVGPYIDWSNGAALHSNAMVTGYHCHHNLVIFYLLVMSHICFTVESASQFAKTLK